MTNQEENTWGEFSRYHQDEGFQKLWRTHSDSVNIALLIRWQPVNQTGSLLKTDLLYEAVSDELSSWINSQAKKVFYIDTSLEVHQMAQCHHSHLQTIGADVRSLPFSQGTFDGII